jgi:hypothetical protein
MAILTSNVFFILIRSCIRHKLQLDQIDEKRQLPNVDTIIAVSEVANAFHAQFVPCFVNTFLKFTPTGDNSGLETQLSIIFVSNYLSLLAIVFLIFVPWKKGPDIYLKVSPYIFYTMMLRDPTNRQYWPFDLLHSQPKIQLEN